MATLPDYPWIPGNQLGAFQLDAAFVHLQNQVNSYAAILANIQLNGTNGGAMAITMNWAGGAVLANGVYVVMLDAPYQFILQSVDYTIGTAGGSFSFEVQKDDVAIGGLSGVTVTSSVVTTSIATANNLIDIGDKVEVVISGVSGLPTDVVIELNGFRGSFVPSGTVTYTWVDNNDFFLITNNGDIIVFNILV